MCKKEVLYFVFYEGCCDFKPNSDNCIKEAYIKDKNKRKPLLSCEFQVLNLPV